ncbi:hypothetical protein AB3662_17355 [Sorangium cellulosum]|uniref:hypothetical protein n=1 Tax=Sorangium cellulosum TaxID=56 RepID=UPI003D9A88DD
MKWIRTFAAPTLIVLGDVSVAQAQDTQYKLARDAFELQVDHIPVVRTRCWASRGSDQAKLVEWDPQDSSSSPTQRVYLRRYENVAPTVLCSSEPTSIDIDGKKVQVVYDWQAVETNGNWTLTGTLRPLLQKKPTGDAVAQDVKVTFKRDPTKDNPTIAQLLGSGLPAITRARALDPLTPVAKGLNEFLAVAAEVAIDRAKRNAILNIRQTLSDALCTRITYGNFREILDLPQDDDSSGPLLPRTCDTVRTLRVEELAASSKMLERSLAADLLPLSLKLIHIEEANGLKKIVTTMAGVVLSLVDGRALASERDVQMLIMQLASIELSSTAPVWKKALSAGFALTVECMQQAECTADRLNKAIDDEIRDKDELKKVYNESWPALRSLLARTIDVLRPPPGATSNMTAKAAVNILFDVLDYVVVADVKTTQQAKAPVSKGASPQQQARPAPQAAGAAPPEPADAVAEVQQKLGAARALLNAILERNLPAGLSAASAVVAGAVDTYCSREHEDGGSCAVWMTSSQSRKVFSLLNAFVSYASTYGGEADDDGAKGDAASAEAEKARHEERKRAMEQLINTFTDRENRAPGEWVWSAGIDVGMSLGANWRRSVESGAKFKPEFVPALSLPMGIAVERLKSGWAPGMHMHVSLLDVAQYITVGQEGDIAEPNVATAVYIGGTLGLLAGPASMPLQIGVSGGYAPGLRLRDDERKGAFRLGGFVGTYVPFLDFN